MPGRIGIHVLGAVGLDRDGSPITLRSTKVAGLLGLLALRRGSVVPAETLIDALWGEEPPRTARNALQVHISTLRKLLSGDPGIRLEHRDPGYALVCPPGRIDLERFRRLLARARDAAGRDEHHAARDLLERALDLWRGRPLEGLDIPGLPVADIEALVEERNAATTLRFETELALGRHREILPDVEAELLARPHDERLAAVAALACYRAGRHADALEVLARLRRSLAEEFGVDPGPATAQLERAILQHDPGLQPPATSTREAPRTARRIVTALICRLGSTSERVDPEVDRPRLDAAAAIVREAASAYGGHVSAAIGGRISALFGLIETHEDDPLRAARAAHEVRARIATIEGVGAVRIGIAVGEVLTRGDGEHRSLLSGAPLDHADRLAQVARDGEILLSPTARRLAGDAISAETLHLLPEHGEPITAHRLLGVSPAGRRRRGPVGPMIGRGSDMAVLRGALERTERTGVPCLISVVGVAGIGKSRLVAEFVEPLSPRCVVLRGHCLPYGRNTTFWPLSEIVRAAAHVPIGTPTADASAALRRALSGSDEEEARFVADHMLALLGLEPLTTRPEEIAWSVARLLRSVARDRVLLLVIEDLHWAEEPFLDLLEELLIAARGTPLLLLCTARPELLERRPTWGAGHVEATNLLLAPLGEEEAAEMLSHLLGGGHLEPTLRRWILETAAGHPLYLEELLETLVEEEVIRWREDRWEATADARELPLPLSLQALIGSRLDRLPTRERRLLERAAIVGRAFTPMDLEAFGETEPAEVFESLVRREFLLRDLDGAGGVTYRFRHPLIREVVYRAMPKRERAVGHAAFGAALERRVGPAVGEMDEVIAYHLDTALRYRTALGAPPDPALAQRAVEHLTSAARRAFAREDLRAAADLFGRAVALTSEDDPRFPDLCWHHAVALAETGHLRRAVAQLERGAAAAFRGRDPRWRWRIELELADVRSWIDPKRWTAARLREVAAAALTGLEALGDRAGLARAHRLMGDALATEGRTQEAAAAFERAARYAEQARDERELRQRLTYGGAYGALPVDRCIEMLESWLARERRPDPDTLSTLGLMMAMADDGPAAADVLARAAARARELGATWKEANVAMHRGAALLILGDAEGAEGSLRLAVRSLERIGDTGMLSTALALHGEALYRLGRDDEALEATSASARMSAEDDVASQMAWRATRAKLLARRGDGGEAERLAREATAIADDTDLLSMAGDTHLDLATVLIQVGRRSEAATEMERALDLFVRKGNVASARRAQAALERLRAEALGDAARLR